MDTLDWLQSRRVRKIIGSAALVVSLIAGYYYVKNVYLPNAFDHMTSVLQHWGEK